MKLQCYAIGPTAPTLRPARPDRPWMDSFTARHAYRCLPLTIANTYGWEVLSPTSFSIHWNGGMESEDIQFESHDGFRDLNHFAVSNFKRGVVTFHTGYIFRTEPGWNLMATGSFNSPKDGISPLTGIIETDWLPYPFTMNWQLTRPGVVHFEKDEPFCLVFPTPQQALESVQPEILALDANPDLAAQHLAWREQREQFMAKFRAGDPATLKEAWQRFYFKGRLPDTQHDNRAHVQKLRLAAPVDLRSRPTVDPSLLNTVVTVSSVWPQPAEQEQNSASHVRHDPQPSAHDSHADVLRMERFLSAEECAELIAAFTRSQGQLIPTPGRQDTFFDNRFLWINSLPTETERNAKRIMQAARFRCIAEIVKFYGEQTTIYSDSIQLVKWEQGMSMPLHSDNSNPDGSHHPTPFRKYASVVYLNENYEGGELFLPSLGLEIKPQTGLLVAFRGDRTHAHGVKPVTAGVRYTMPGWYTDDIQHRDPYSLEIY